MSAYFVDLSQCHSFELFPGVRLHTLAGREIMLSYVVLEPGAVVERHSHPHEQGGIVLEGRATFFVGDEERTLGPGAMYHIPGGVPHRVVALDERCVALDVFHPIREDYLPA